jgi:hypothetical protein
MNEKLRLKNLQISNDLVPYSQPIVMLVLSSTYHQSSNYVIPA